MAKVVRLKRSKGVVVQNCDVYIGRRMTMGGWNLPDSKWKNPYTVKECGSNEAAVKKFEAYIRNKPELLADIEELRGKTLGNLLFPLISLTFLFFFFFFLFFFFFFFLIYT